MIHCQSTAPYISIFSDDLVIIGTIKSLFNPNLEVNKSCRFLHSYQAGWFMLSTDFLVDFVVEKFHEFIFRDERIINDAQQSAHEIPSLFENKINDVGL